jgi:hypothetical protein
MATQFDTKSPLTNRRLRKDLKDALADQKGVITAKIAAKEPLTAKEAKILRSMLRDRDGKLTAKIAAGLAAPGNLPNAKEKALLLSVLADQPRVLTEKIAAGESLED